MATLLSSPMGPPARFDIFDQPSSPKFAQDDLPPDFDKSFGSSMSISSSFDGSHMAQLRAGGQVQQPCFNPSFGLHAAFQQSLHAPSQATTKSSRTEAERISPRRSPNLGASMGTFLNRRSPGLAAKLSSPQDMDISPPVKTAMPSLMQTFADEKPGPSRRITDRVSPASAASLGRLFGTELSLNSLRVSDDNEDEALSSPDKEPPPKRRPSSLPSRQTETNQASLAPRPNMMKQPSLAPSQTRSRPALMKCFTDSPFEGTQHSALNTKTVAPRHRMSDPSLVSALGSRPTRTRAASTDSLFGEPNDLSYSAVEGRTLLHDTIVEYPSPSPSMDGGIGSYFFDPQSPAHHSIGATKPGPACAVRPSLMASLSSSPSSPVSSPSNRAPPAKRPSLGSRTFEKTHSTACVPTNGSLSSAASTRTSLGKRANPYIKRPPLGLDNRPLKSAYPVLGLPGTTSVTRPTAPAPRRCHSALDNSSYLMQGSSLRNTTLAATPASPERKPIVKMDYGEMSDANGSPIAPSSRARHRPSLLRRGSKDDSSPLGYGTGMKRSGSRSGESMVDDLGLEDVPQMSSPFGAEGMPGFGASEREGKILPCFTVKEDGLMRISSHTLTDLLHGKYDDSITSYNIIDCRFGYEYQGGHIPGAINLSTMDKVKNHFLVPGEGLHAEGKSLPTRSQSGKPDANGNMRKHVLVFHCEFSCKRAPSMALALRQADRALAHDYPNCHFPEVYVLQGGYCEYFRTYSSLCQPQAYVCMDDPRYQDRRSTELNGFRKQFARHRSFTYGESKASAPSLGKGLCGPSIREEELSIDESPCAAGSARLGAKLGDSMNVGDTSFGSVGDSSFEEGIGDSPCAAAGSRRPSMMLNPGPAIPQPSGVRTGSLSRRVMQRAGTTANILTRPGL